MKFKDITSKLTKKNVALGLGVAVTSVALTNGYLKFEEYIGQKMFCNEYGHLKWQSRNVLEKNAIEYDKNWSIKVHPSNREKRTNNFIRWVEECE